jgi:predicted nuclease of predicted toxin-antitoxin system
MAIKLLIDECMSPRLIGLAHGRGIEATHVNYLGLRKAPDHILMPVIVGGDYTFVTNNRADFIRLYRYVDLHAGLLVIVPAVEFQEQRRLLALALDAIAAADGDATNELVEVFADGRVEMSRWPFTGENQ